MHFQAVALTRKEMLFREQFQIKTVITAAKKPSVYRSCHQFRERDLIDFSTILHLFQIA